MTGRARGPIGVLLLMPWLVSLLNGPERGVWESECWEGWVPLLFISAGKSWTSDCFEDALARQLSKINAMRSSLRCGGLA